MKITKELLEHLKVKTISLDNCGENVLCFLERIDNGKWTFSITRAIDLSKNKKLSFMNTKFLYLVQNSLIQERIDVKLYLKKKT